MDVEVEQERAQRKENTKRKVVTFFFFQASGTPQCAVSVVR